jgi:hypothetical protein
MKTQKIFIVLCFIAAFAVIPVKAQNNVDKQVVTVNLGGYYLECTGDYLYGDLTGEYFFMSHNWIAKAKKTMVTGYLDPDGTILSGNVYEFSQNGVGLNFEELSGIFRLNGKVVAVVHISYHTTTNANGDVVVDRFIYTTNCK